MTHKLGENIRALRKSRGMTQERLAELLGVTAGAVHKWEKGASVPDIDYILALADLFELSLDLLFGYESKGGSPGELAEEMEHFYKKKDLASACALAERAMKKYPNDFRVIYKCALVYRLKGIEQRDMGAFEKALRLFEQALVLLPQNTDPELDEFTLRGHMANCYLELGETERGIELLKEHDPGGIHNALIGYYMAGVLKREEAIPYLSSGFALSMQQLIYAAQGYFNLYENRGDYRELYDDVLWLCGFLDSLKREEAPAYTDKLKTRFLPEAARAALKLGEREKARALLREAAGLAQGFDREPCYSLDGLRFCRGLEGSAVFDGMGGGALAALREAVYSQPGERELIALWEEAENG